MDPAAIWTEIERFQEQGLATTAAIHGGSQEKLLVQQFLQRVPVDALFAVLQHASDADDAKKASEHSANGSLWRSFCRNSNVAVGVEQVRVTCACIDRVLGSDANDGMFYEPEMLPFIAAGLKHHEKAARVLSVNQLISHLKSNPTLEQARALLDPALLEVLTSVLADEEVEVAAKAATALDLLARVEGGHFYKPIIDSLQATIQDGNVTECSVEFMRYLEAIAKISEQSGEHMKYAISCGAVDIILNCLKSKDTLFVMNVLDLIPKLCDSAVGITHMFESGALHTLLSMNQDPFIGDSAIRLIGEISAAAAKQNIESWNWSDPMLSKAFLSTIEAKVQSPEPLQQIAAMDAIAAFASSSEKELHLLLQHKHLCQLVLQNGGSTKMDLKVNCFHTIARIISAPTGLHKQSNEVAAENANVWTLNERLFLALGGESRRQSTMALLMECLRQPFDEIRIAVFTLLQAVAAQNSDWGMRALLSYGGFFEFLLDRTTEPGKLTREWKFAVVDAVLGSRFLERLDAAMLKKLQDHLAQGPYVGNGLTEMDMEAA